MIELLVVIAIIAILASILFPVFASARESARIISCLSNEHNISLGILQYMQDYDGHFALEFNGCSPGPTPEAQTNVGAYPGYFASNGCGAPGANYWPQVVSAYIQNADSNAGTAGSENAFSKVWFCPDAAYNSAYFKTYSVMNLVSYGISDNFVDWLCPGDCASNSAQPAYDNEIVAPADTIMVAESADSTTPTPYQYPGYSIDFGADDWGDWPYAADTVCSTQFLNELQFSAFRHRNSNSGPNTPNCVMPTSGAINNVIFCDGHVKAEQASFIANQMNWSLKQGAGEQYNGVHCCDCTPLGSGHPPCYWP